MRNKDDSGGIHVLQRMIREVYPRVTNGLSHNGLDIQEDKMAKILNGRKLLLEGLFAVADAERPYVLGLPSCMRKAVHRSCDNDRGSGSSRP